MAADATKVIATRDMLAYTKAYSSSNALPADTVAWGTAWSGYTAEGYTDGGMGFRINTSRDEIKADQALDPIMILPSSRELSLRTQLLEMTANAFLEAGGLGAVATVAAGSGTRGHDELAIGSTVTIAYYTMGIDLLNAGDSEAFRVIGYKGIPVGNPDINWQSNSPGRIPLEMRFVPDTAGSPTGRVALVRDIIAALP